MSKNYNDISHIEAYLRGKMAGQERRDFDAQLSTDEALKTEVEAYRKIFTGLEGLRDEAFVHDVASWVAEAKSDDSDNIVPMQSGATVRPLWRRLAVAASIALLLGFGAAWWGGSQYSDVAIAERGYVAPLSSGTMGEGTQLDEVEALYEAAHQNFQEGKYAAAAERFDQFTATLRGNPAIMDELTANAYLDNARWTGLLAKFAAGQIGEVALKTELEKIAADPAIFLGH